MSVCRPSMPAFSKARRVTSTLESRVLSRPPGPAPCGARACTGFTLLELVLAVSILLILLGLLMPAVRVVSRRAKQKLARAQVQILVHAVTAYRAEYRRWPAQIQDDEDTTYDCQASNLVAALNPTNAHDNPRGLHFQAVAHIPVTNDYFRDPWGRAYVVAMDENGDGNVDVEPGGVTFTTVLNQTAVVLSWGHDTNDSTARICSWE